MNYKINLIGIMMAFCACFCVGCSDDDETLGTATIQVSSFSPTEGLCGTEVTVTGAGFGQSAKVFFNDGEATEYLSRSGNTIVVRVPDNAGTGRIGILDGESFGFSAGTFTVIPSAVIDGYSLDTAPVGETVIINGRNFFDLPVEQIIVRFGSAQATVISATATALTVIVPEGAESGPITVQFGDIQTVTGPEFKVGKIVVVVPDYYFDLSKYEGGYGSFAIESGGNIGSTKRGAYLIYPFKVETDGNYEVNAQTATNQSYACYMNVDMGTDMEELKERAADSSLSQQVTKLGWSTWEDHTYGLFSLKAGVQYYMRIYFWAEGTSWVCNANNFVLHYAEDQESQGIQVGASAGYNLYENNFNEGTELLPFAASWAWEPSYIKVVDQYCEFYFNQAALDNDDRRERRGCELTCDFKTTTEGWYGFKIYLPSSGFPKTLTGSIIAQIFNSGDANTWAGHLKIDGEKLTLAHRSSAGAAEEKEVGALAWDKWIPVVIYFKAGRNNKGNIKVWTGDNLSEGTPTLDTGNINFAFGDWLDDDTLDSTDRDGYKGASLGAKFGLYVSKGGDRTIRFDDVKLLEGNPAGAFSIVKP